ncbi:hypothetical protein [Mucilaginibacter phyllosphaerae]|uniref:Uncharacterized protein n=1 Tax=Mucilaginibacter phyllosphaerae TaxID=1812349 RepID=A0A4Y8A974_9SPHI|nr:hypothetical protein [Mucilaginibacter phyllosphaerae]MBB3970743.1 hypothetical protein [Mucilaginibacter phyllosphaerae]TEW64311.1 hypothetical protein E2R65_18375 [Mucilaginibacter phyllosphaerae]
MITVVGIFEKAELAEEASSYLLANEFTNENIDLHPHQQQAEGPDRIADFFNHLIDDEKQAAHFASLGRNGSIVTVHAVNAREAQEAVDALNNYGAINVDAADDSSSHSQLIERIVDQDKRLKGNTSPAL